MGKSIMRQQKMRKEVKVASTRDGFANFTARMGIGAQNVLSQAQYTFDLLTRNRTKLEAMYRGSWIIGIAVDAVAEDMTRAGVTINGIEDPKKLKDMQTVLTRKGVWSSLLEGIKWGRLYGGAISVIVIDGQDMSTPLDINTITKDQFKGLRVYDRWRLQPDLNDLVEDGIDQGDPKFYRVINSYDGNKANVSNLKIHHSRLIRHLGIKLPYWQALTEELWSEAIPERIYDRLVAFDTSSAGAANLINKAHLRTVQIDGLREVFAAGGEAEENLLTMFHHMRMLQTNEGLTLLDKNDTFATSSYSFSGLSDMMLQFGQQISGATGIPLVRLFGQAPAGLNSTGENDLRMYYDNVNSQQESTLREGMHKLLRIVYRSATGEDVPDSFDFEFVSLWQTSTKEKIDIANVGSTAINNAYTTGTIDLPTAMKELKALSELTGVFGSITELSIKEAEAEPVPLPVESAPLPEEVAPPTDEQPKRTAFDRIKDWLNRG
jgi:hypothetical protein